MPTVYYAGLSYLGKFQLVEHSFPQTLALNRNTESGVGVLDERLRNHFTQYPPAHFKLDYALGDMSKGDHLVMTLAIENELLSREVFVTRRARIEKAIAEVSAQLMVFDYKTMTLVANVPLKLAVNDAENSSAEGLFRMVYHSGPKGEGLLEMAARKATTLSLSSRHTRRFQVREVSASSAINQHFAKANDLARFRQHLGQYFSSNIAAQTAVSMLPYTRGYAIGNQLPTRFSDGRAYTIAVPEPDVAISLNVDKFHKQKSRDYDVYGSIARLSIHNLLTDTVHLDEDFVYSVTKLKAGRQVKIDELSAYEDSVEQLLADLTQQFNSPSGRWFKEHARSKSVVRKFKAIKKLYF